MVSLLDTFKALPDIILDQMINTQSEPWLWYLTFIFVQAVRENKIIDYTKQNIGITPYYELIFDYFQEHVKQFWYIAWLNLDVPIDLIHNNT